MEEENYYININIPDLIRYLRDIKVPEDKIKLIVEYCIMRRDKELENKHGVK